MNKIYSSAAAPVAIACAAMAMLGAGAASARVKQDRQLWINFSAQGKLGGGKLWTAELHPRIGKNLSAPTALLGRVAIGFAASKRVTLHQGLVYQEIFDGQPRRENRPYQQVDLDIASGDWGALTGRLRLEQRWFSTGSDMGLRFREQIRFERPLSDAERSPTGVLAAEAFVNVLNTDYGARRGFEAARLFAGVRLPLAEQAVEAGYQAQISAPPRSDSRVDHILLLTFRLRP
ncbi:DUF2490 domain-containing protein [Sphingomonas sp. IC-11]|uniref:DUF2490 domain-containing protein n=1 Tax=Sphingomonas sp. IC-11 TaxID=2898528 RepID=UPI001E2A5211|nr:DUF2490 domain-containing protein [Sphingomonas sp. IC-11]